MPEYIIAGVSVTFPFEPYAVQTAYMKKVILALENSQNAVLESPTGTGKTLSLLCSALAWLQQQKTKQQEQINAQLAALEKINRAQLNEKKFLQTSDLPFDLQQLMDQAEQKALVGVPKIIYASRTHSQLNQAVQELKRSAYSSLKSVTIGGRDQLCIDDEVNLEVGNGNKMHGCKKKVDAKNCTFHSGVEGARNHALIKQANVLDIEDLVKIGKQHRCCPYFLSKHLMQTSDIIFMPYNYILDPQLRKANQVELENSVIILDEGHNVEKLCEESASIQICSSDIILASDDVNHIIQQLTDDKTLLGRNSMEKDFTIADCELVRDILLKLEKVVEDIPVQFSSGEATFDGGHIFTLLQQANITHQNSNSVKKVVDSMIQFMAGGQYKVSSRKAQGLHTISNLMAIVFIFNQQDYKDKLERGYKVHVEREERNKKPYTRRTDFMNPVIKPNAKIINYWCFNPGFAMTLLLGTQIRSIILTSGTLAPLQALISELSIPVGQRLENPHIIDNSQVCVKVVSSGPDGELLDSSFKNRENPKYLDSLGRTILSFCNLIPHGLLVFFPSYPMMNKSVEHWKKTGTWAQIVSIKGVFIEPRVKDAFARTMNEYYVKVDDPTGKGAVFFAVCRGKVSEGLDFADNNGRAVIVTGLPFPPLRDPKIILKKQYLDTNRNRENGLLSGAEWYNLEATRAVNQAIGRVIRHKNDYGAILLCDSRFNNPQNKDKLSSWIQNHLKLPQSPTFGPIVGQIGRFFRNCERTLPQPVKKVNIEIAMESTDAPSTSINEPQNFPNLQLQKPGASVDFKALITSTLEQQKTDYRKMEERECTSGLNKKPQSTTIIDCDSSTTTVFDSTNDASTSLVKIHKLSQKRKYSLNNSEIDEIINITDETLSAPKKGIILTIPQVEVKTEMKTGLNTSVEIQQVIEQKLPENKLDLLKMIRRTLNRDGYKKFITVLQEYNSSNSIGALFGGLMETFSDPSHKFVVVGMGRFVKTIHMAAFNEMIAAHYN